MKIAVIGAGVMGLVTAHHCALRGGRVTVYERRPEAGRGCSWYAGGMLAAWCEMESAEPLIGELGLESLSYWKTHFSHVVEKGTLVIAPPRDLPDLKRFAVRTQAHEWVGRDAVASLEPDLAERFETALFFKGEAHLDPRDTLDALRQKLVADYGVTFVMDHAVTPNDVDADHIFDCRGYEARDVLSDLRGVKGEMLILRTKEVSLSRPIRLVHPRIPVYIVPRTDHHFMVGATMIESGDRTRFSVRSMVELLNAAYAVHPAFGEAEMQAIGAWASGGDGSKDSPVVIHANRRTFGKITQQAWLTERFGQAPDEWNLVMSLVYGKAERRFESVRIRTDGGQEHVLHFDITEWFGLRRRAG